MNFLDHLKQYEDTFAKAQTREPGEFDPLPDGKYKVKVDKVFFSENKYSGLPQLTWEFLVVEGKYEKRKVFKFNQLDSDDRIGWLKQDFRNCGTPIDRIQEIEPTLEKLLDRTLIVKLTSNVSSNGKTYQNVYIIKSIEQPKGIVMPPLSDEDLPF